MPYIKYFLSSALLTIFLFICLNLYIQPLSGDLTRLGNLSENDFGWNAQQPVLVLSKQDEIHPNVIVLGDSFSLDNVWQSVVMIKGEYHFLTFHWGDPEHPEHLESWIVSLKKDYPTIQYVIVETVERSFLHRFNTTQNSAPAEKLPLNKTETNCTASKRNIAVSFALSDPNYLVKAIINRKKSFPITTVNGKTFISPLNRSDLFSNIRSDRLLYYAEDNIKKDWSLDEVRTAVSNIKKIQDSAKRIGIVFILAVVPDKSRMYGKFLRSPQFDHQTPDVWEELDKQGINQVDLKNTLNSAVDQTQDLYLPNDTHLSTKGYMLMGDAVSKRLNEVPSISCTENPSTKK